MSAKLLLRLVSACVFALLLLSFACQQTTPPINQPAMTADDSRSWDSYLNGFLEAYFVAHPDFAVRAGRHEFDGKLPDWSAERLVKQVSRLKAEEEQVTGVTATGLGERRRYAIEYVRS